MQNILLATDGSKTAARAVDVAARLAQSLGLTLWIVHVTDGRDGTAAEIAAFSRAEHLSRGEMIEALATQLLVEARERAEAIGVRDVHIEARSGDVAETILALAREKGADAIVVGRRGQGTLAGLLLGSVAQKLVSLAPCTVIVVP